VLAGLRAPRGVVLCTAVVLAYAGARHLDGEAFSVVIPDACPGIPPVPSGLAAIVNGSALTLTWQTSAGGCAATQYVIEAGSSPGLSNLASLPTGAASTTFSTSGVPNGTYFVRIRASNASGTSGPSNEVSFTVGATACTGTPGPPTNMTASAAGSTVSLAWSAPSASCGVTSYFIEAGAVPGFRDLAAFSTGNTALAFSTAPVGNGTFYLRVRAENAIGRGAASNEVALTVGPTSATAFKSGIYFRVPGLTDPAARLARIGDTLSQVVPQVLSMAPHGIDFCSSYLVHPLGGSPGGVRLVTPAGVKRDVQVPDIYRAARPTISADCRYAAVQASATPGVVNGAEDLNIYVIDLQTGTSKQISSLSYNEESPRFFPSGHRLAYSSFSPTEGVNLHIYDLDQDRELASHRDIGALQIAISPDGSQFIDPRKMRIYRLDTGALVADLLSRAVQSILAAGYQLDQRFNDAASYPNRGVYPLDAAFSPSGGQLALDWAVSNGSAYGNVIATMSISQNDFAVVTELLPTNPALNNSNNFSQLNPRWK
jgi:hypothetical protein